VLDKFYKKDYNNLLYIDLSVQRWKVESLAGPGIADTGIFCSGHCKALTSPLPGLGPGRKLDEDNSPIGEEIRARAEMVADLQLLHRPKPIGLVNQQNGC